MDTKNDTTTPKRDERAADSALSASPGSRSNETYAMFNGYKQFCKIEKLANAQGLIEIAESAHYGGMLLGMTLGIDVIREIEKELDEVGAIARKIFAENTEISGCEPTDKAQH